MIQSELQLEDLKSDQHLAAMLKSNTWTQLQKAERRLVAVMSQMSHWTTELTLSPTQTELLLLQLHTFNIYI